MSYANAIRMGDVVKASVNENVFAKAIGAEILEEYLGLDRDELGDKLYTLITTVAAFTATQVMAELMSDTDIDDMADAITDLMSLNGEEGDN